MDGGQCLGLQEVLGGVANGEVDVLLEVGTLFGSFLDSATLLRRNFSCEAGTGSANGEPKLVCANGWLVARMMVPQIWWCVSMERIGVPRGADWSTGVAVIFENNPPSFAVVGRSDHHAGEIQILVPGLSHRHLDQNAFLDLDLRPPPRSRPRHDSFAR